MNGELLASPWAGHIALCDGRGGHGGTAIRNVKGLPRLLVSVSFNAHLLPHSFLGIHPTQSSLLESPAYTREREGYR